MALQKQVITLDFGYGGLDQKSDEKRVLPVRFTELTDVRFNKIGRVDRRPGHAAFGTISRTVSKIVTANDCILAVSERSGATTPLAFRVTTNGSLTVQSLPPPTMAINEVVADPTGTQRSFGAPNASGTATGGWSRADSNDYFMIVYTNGDGTGTFYGEMYDKATGNFFKTAGGGTGIRPRVWAHPDGRNQFLVGYNTSTTTTVVFQTVSDTAGSFTVVGQPSEATVEQGEWDAWVCADNAQSSSAIVFVAYAKSTSGIKIRTSPWPDSLGAGSTLSTTTIAVTSGTVTRVALCNAHNWTVTTSNANARAVWFETGAGIRTMTFNHSLTTVLANVSITTGTTAPNFITGVAHAGGAGSNNTWVGVEYDGASGNWDKKIDVWTINTSNTATNVSLTLKGLCLNSKMMSANTESVAYFWTAYSSTLQNTMFLTALNFVGDEFPSYAAHPARMFHTYGWGPISRTDSGLPNMYVSGSEIIAPAMALRRSTLLGFQQDQWSMHGLRINKSNTVGWLPAQIRDEAIISGGFPAYINSVDGPLPAAPMLYPQIVSVSATTSGGSMALGAYAVSGLFEYTDGMGRVRRSAPATPVTFSLTGSQNALIVTVEAYRLKDGLGDMNRLKFVPFRTLANESQVYYRTVSITATTSLTNTLLMNLNDADATVDDNEPLYTTGGVLEDWQPDAPIAIATNGRRCLAVSGRRPTFVMESKPIQEKSGVAFFEEVGREISPNGSRIYALASYQDKWFAFKETAVFVAQGDGADVTGQNDTLSEFQPLTNGLGTTQPRSVITTSVGTVFNSQRGFYIIGADLQPTYIGASVEDYTSAVIDSSYDEVNDIAYFALADGTMLVLTVFSTEQGVETRWSTDTLAAVNSVACIGGYRYIAPKSISGLASSIYKETPSTYIDANVSATAAPAMAATTAWTAMGQIQGFGRVWKVLCLGTFPAAQLSTTVTVQIAYDYSSTWTETHTIASTAFQQNGNNCQFEIRPARQKCEAIRFRITQGAPASGTAQGLSLNQIQLVVGVKANDNKTPATSRMTKG